MSDSISSNDLKNVVFVTFSDVNCQRGKQRLTFEAHQSGLFHKYVIGGPELFDAEFYQSVGSIIFEKRGFGYWIWKPWIILQTLKRMNDNDVLWYFDAGCHININDKSKERFHHYINQINEESGKCFFCFPLHYPSNGSTLVNGDWCKHDTLAHFGLLDDEEFKESAQLIATTMGIRKCRESVTLVKKWFKACCNKALIDDSSTIDSKIHRPSFKDHRHDMSILNCVLWTEGGRKVTSVAPFDETWFENWVKDGSSFPIWATRWR